MKNIYMVKTFYPHWGKHTAFNAFLPCFDARRFAITMVNVPMGGGKRLFSLLKYFSSRLRRAGTMSPYGAHDLRAEIAAFYRSAFNTIDVIHLLDAEHSLLFLPSWFKKISHRKAWPKIIATFHQPPSLLAGMIDMETVSQVDTVLVISPAQAEFFSNYLPEEKIATILLGVDTEHFIPAPHKKGGDRFRCLSGGVWLRDYDAVYRTAELLKDQPHIEFHIVAPRDASRAALPNIFYHEGITDAELLRLYQISDVLFLPLRDATANTFLLEGCACGLPVISTDLPSVRFYFPGEEAVLVQDNQPPVFARIIDDMSRNPAAVAARSRKARERAEMLSWRRMVKQYERLYEEL